MFAQSMEEPSSSSSSLASALDGTRRFCRATTEWDRTEVRQAQELLEAWKKALGSRRSALVRRAHGRPLLQQCASDGTPVMAFKTYVSTCEAQKTSQKRMGRAHAGIPCAVRGHHVPRGQRSSLHFNDARDAAAHSRQYICSIVCGNAGHHATFVASGALGHRLASPLLGPRLLLVAI